MSGEQAPDWEDRFSIQTITSPEECRASFEIMSNQGWNMRWPKWKKLIQVFPSDIFVMVNKMSQEVVATASALLTRAGQYVVGNLIVKETHRGKGLGRKMVNYLMGIHKGDTLALTAVPSALEFYRHVGFHEVGPTHDIDYLEINRVQLEAAYFKYSVDNVDTASYSPNLLQAMGDYDKQARGYDASDFLSVVIGWSPTLLVATSKPTGDIVGYIVGYVLGKDPSSRVMVDGLYADSDAIALMLFRKLVQTYPDHKVFKVQTIKPRNFILQFGNVLPISYPYKRMATGVTAQWSLSKSYAVFDCSYAE